MIDRLNAALEDRYRIERELGAGGMATVYLAEDLKHDRQVAIKVLKPELAAVIGGDRFVTEIKTTASLQHPHILPLFDSGAADGFLYYVMPYVEGESLREKLDREKQLGVEEAVKIATAVASALHYAHERGIVHRDIKPANILLHAGEPVVADFGIALAISAAGGGRLTETGMSVGTPHYMSPEQASADRDVSARSDLYSLACVLYEMLAGDPPHTGPSAQVILMRILTEEPREVSEVRKAVPPNVQAALVKALEKLPADRFKTADEFKRALSDPDFRYQPGPRTGAGAGGRRSGSGDAGHWATDTRTRVLAAVCFVLLAATGWSLVRGGGSPEQAMPGTGPVYRYVIEDSLQEDVLSFDISGNGDVVYSAEMDGRRHLRLRRAADTLIREIPGTDNAAFPLFSPDGEWVTFLTEYENLKKVQISTGTLVNLATAGESLTLYHLCQWTDDGFIVFSAGDGVYRVPEVGGAPERIHEAGPSVNARVLPDRRTLMFTEFPSNPSDVSVMVVDYPTGDTLTVIENAGNSIWSPTGHILHGHPSGSVFAFPFDLDRQEVMGPSVPVREGVLTIGAVSLFALSSSGALVYYTGEGTGENLQSEVFAWMDMDGSFSPIPIAPTDHADARLSPDGRYIAYTREGHIYIFDLELGTNQRLTFTEADHHDPVWSPDGTRVAYSSDQAGGSGSFDIYLKAVDGRSEEEWLGGTEGEDYPSQWLEDGTVLAYNRPARGSPGDIWMMNVAEAGQAEPTFLLQADWNEAYRSEEHTSELQSQQ